MSRLLFLQRQLDASLHPFLPADDSEQVLRPSLPGWSARPGFLPVSKCCFPVLWCSSHGGVLYPVLELDIAKDFVPCAEYD